MAMQITEIFYPKTRQDWRNWLMDNHAKKSEIWLQLFKKATGKPSLAYDGLVEECLCFGWIDSVVKKLDDESRVQRIIETGTSKSRMPEAERRLNYLIKMTKQGKRYGAYPLEG